jgi:hypothetical protein
MFTNRKLISALGLAGLVVGGAAQAAGLVSPGNAFHISGSTALDNQIKDALLLVPANGGPCTAGTISVYTDAPFLGAGTGNLTKSHQATVVCSLAAAMGTGANQIAAGTVVSFTKESNGGSNEGTYYPAAQATLAFFDATQTPVGCTAVGALAAGYYWTHQQAIAGEYDGCTGTIIQAIPEVGVADEDPALFNIGPQAISAALIQKLNTTPLFQNQFAIGVSLNLYRALQTAQGLTVGDDTLANMPSLTKAEISGLYSGSITAWSQIDGLNNTTSNVVYTCRRGDNSGTNVSADVYFLHNRCSTTGTPMVQATTTAGNCNSLSAGQTPENNGCHWTNANVTDVVFPGAAGGDVASCLDDHSRVGTWAFGHLGATSKFDDPNGASGAAGETGSNHWRYIAIGGNKPTVEGMANGNYDYAFNNVENLYTGLTGPSLSVGAFLGILFQSPVALTDILVAQPNAQTLAHAVDANYVTGGLQDGYTGTPLATPTTIAAVQANPTSQFTLAYGGSVNNCQVPLVVGTAVSKEQY